MSTEHRAPRTTKHWHNSTEVIPFDDAANRLAKSFCDCRVILTRVQAPIFEDRLFGDLLPFAAYAILAACALVASLDIGRGLYVVGGAVPLLLFIGIHNAWDEVVYHVFSKRLKDAKVERN